MLRWWCFTLVLITAGCASLGPAPEPPSDTHLTVDADAPDDPAAIPAVVDQTEFVPPPEPLPESERYTVVVNDVPLRELLFALARDAEMNIDVAGEIDGRVTLNAIDQTLPQILQRIARQTPIRFTIDGDAVFIEADTPYFHTYIIDYVNMSRDSELETTVSTQIEAAVETTGNNQAANNNSKTNVTSISNNQFWRRLTLNVLALLGESPVDEGSASVLPRSDRVIANPEAGVMNVLATRAQHDEVQAFIDRVVENAQRQVLVEATIVEVELNKDYQAGIDWSVVQNDGVGVQSTLNLVGAPPVGAMTTFVLEYLNQDADGIDIRATVSALEQFGNARVLSSPRIMVLNNQTAVLKVAENRVFFTIEAETTQNQNNSLTVFTTTPRTVPVGFVLNVTPQISDTDAVLLNIRPTISRIIGFVEDPNPALRSAGGVEFAEPIVSRIPEIAVRELESILQVSDGQVAVLGGLMQDNINDSNNGIPLLSDIPVVGDAVFSSRTNTVQKTELVVFLRPVIVRNPSIDRDLRDYRRFLERHTSRAEGLGGAAR